MAVDEGESGVGRRTLLRWVDGVWRSRQDLPWMASDGLAGVVTGTTFTTPLSLTSKHWFAINQVLDVMRKKVIESPLVRAELVF